MAARNGGLCRDDERNGRGSTWARRTGGLPARASAAGALRATGPGIDLLLLATAVAAAFAGALLGRRYLAKATMPGLQRLVGALLVLVALGLITGVL